LTLLELSARGSLTGASASGAAIASGAGPPGAVTELPGAVTELPGAVTELPGAVTELPGLVMAPSDVVMAEVSSPLAPPCLSAAGTGRYVPQ
jgi:hypothetical protein